MPLSPWRLRLLIVSLLTVSILGALDHTIVATSLATVAGELGALQHMSWIIVGYTLASTVLLPILGKLGDAAGPRVIFMTSVILFLVASLACGFAQDLTQLVIGRVVQGMSSAGMHLMSQTIIAEVTTPRERPKYLAVVGAAFPVAILVGPVLGGVITDYWGWPWVFWINVPFGLMALVLAAIAVPRLPGFGRRRFDVAGAVTFTVALVALVLGVTSIGDPELRVASVVAFGVAGVAFVAFFIIELRTTEPLVPLRLFANRTFAAGVALSSIIGIGLFSITAYLPTYFQMAYRTSATLSGLVPIATVFGMLVSSLATGWLVSRTGHYRVYPIAGTSLAAAGLFAMSLLPVGVPLWVPAVVMALVGIGTGAFMSLVVAVAQSAAPRRDTGSATATVNLVRQIGSTVGTAVVGGVIGFGVAAQLPAFLNASTLTPQLVRDAAPAVQAEVAGIYADVFAPVFAALGIVYALGIIAAILLPTGALSNEAESAPASSSAPVTA